MPNPYVDHITGDNNETIDIYDSALRNTIGQNGGLATLDNNGKVPSSQLDLIGKADKVSGATENNFAALDANGNLKDSGHKHSDYLTQHQDISGKADKVSSATNGNLAGLNGSGNITDSGWNGAKDTTSISGNPISIPDLKSNQLAVNPIITLEPIQDLHGQSKPYPAGGGKNKLPMTVQSIKDANTSGGSWSANVWTSTNGVSFTIVTDNADNVIGIKVNGTASANTIFHLLSEQLTVSSGNYTMSGCPAGGSSTTYALRLYYNDTSTYVDDNGGNGATVSTSLITGSRIIIRSGYTASNIMFYPQVESGSAKTAFAPPSNICPISGYDKIEVLSCGKNLFDVDKVIRNSAISVSGNNISLTPVGYNTDLFSGNTGESGASAKKLYLKAGTYAISFSFVGTAPQLNSIYVNTIDETTLIPNGNIGRKTSGQTFVITESSWICLKLVSNSTCTLKDIQIEESTSATSYVPYVKATSISESLGQTVYLGELDVRNGKFKVTHGEKDMGDLTYSYNSTYERFSASVSDMTASIASLNWLCECYETSGKAYIDSDRTDAQISARNSNIYIRDSRYTDGSNLKTALTGIKLIYPLTTPFYIQLTPHEISLLKDYAYISTNGTSIALDYHNGELASLSDVSQLGETVNELGEYVIKGIEGIKGITINVGSFTTDLTANTQKRITGNQITSGSLPQSRYDNCFYQVINSGSVLGNGIQIMVDANRLFLTSDVTTTGAEIKWIEILTP